MPFEIPSPARSCDYPKARWLGMGSAFTRSWSERAERTAGDQLGGSGSQWDDIAHETAVWPAAIVGTATLCFRN